MMPLLLTLWHSLVEQAFAAPPPLPACGAFTNLYGCGGATNVLSTLTIPNITIFLLRLVGASSVLFIVWSGVTLMTSLDDAGKRTQARHSILYVMGAVALAVCSQLIVSFVTTEEYGQSNPSNFIIGGLFANAVRIILILVNVTLGLIVVIQGIRMVLAQGKSDQYGNARSAIMWAIIGAIVINAALAIVRIVTSFFGV
jgi:hypothetical protein